MPEDGTKYHQSPSRGCVRWPLPHNCHSALLEEGDSEAMETEGLEVGGRVQEQKLYQLHVRGHSSLHHVLGLQ